MQRLSFHTKKNENCCDVCVVSHISTAKHFIIPRGATNSDAKPHHHWRGGRAPFACSVTSPLSCQSCGTTLTTISPSSVTARQVSWHASSLVDVERADNHPHSSVPPSPHPQDLLLPRHTSICSVDGTRMCFLMMGYTVFFPLNLPKLLRCILIT